MTEQTAEAAATEAEENDQQGTDTEPDWKTEADKWKTLARKHEDQWKANSDKVAQYDRLVEASKTDQERLEERAAKAEANGSSLAEENLRLKVALAKGVPADLIERLRGANQEELEKDADFLLEKFGTGQQPVNGVPDLRAAAGQRPIAQEVDGDQWMRRASGRR